MLTTSLYEHPSVYDFLRAGDDYDDWAKLLLDRVERYVPGRGRLLDLGCGTGNSSLPFARLGFEVTGCDISQAMLNMAKTKDPGGIIDYQRLDMRHLPPDLGLYSIINWMDDVANHLLSIEDLLAALRSSAARLAPGGVLVFDVNTTAAFRAIACQNHILENDDHCLQIAPADNYLPPYGLVTARIVHFARVAELWERNESTITERFYNHEEISSTLDEAGLRILEQHSLHNDRLFSPPDEENHGKIIYITAKK